MPSLIYRVRRFIVNRSSSDRKIRFLRSQGMKIGANCLLETMDFAGDPYMIELGDNVAIANGTTFIPHDGAILCFKEEFPGDDVYGQIKIGNNVFIGTKCTILLNTEIGDNCIIGAGSVVRGKFPNNSVIVGNPAKRVTDMDIQRLLYKINPDRIPTAKMSEKQKKQYITKHFTKKTR